MSHPLYVAFIWHQHQPLYKSREAISEFSRQYRLPWVRLHGTKDYLDLMLVLERYPKLHQTVNLVPSLILQLEEYAEGAAIDPYMALTLTPEERLSQSQQRFIIERFFDAKRRTLIEPHPRYAQLYFQRQQKGRDWCLENWTLQDYSDLLAWHNLAWIDPIFWDDPEIDAWLKQGKGFTLSDRQRIYSKQRQIIRQIIPQHRSMQERGQLEVITSPYAHPILPLLADTNSARVALPDTLLPQHRFESILDVSRHLRKARDVYIDRFGQMPRGLWPSEMAVSPQILPAIAKEGFKWICSDETVLGCTIEHYFTRDRAGSIEDPEILYRPYRLETPYGNLAIVFRDRFLSESIGFKYATMEPRAAVLDFEKHLEAISRTLKERQSNSRTSLEKPWLVTVALDGQNCWESYQKDGLPFLETLYARLSDASDIQLVSVSEFLDKFSAKAIIPAERLHSGSWIDASFAPWIGNPIQDRAWDFLTEARRVLDKHPEATEANNPEAWESLDAAEGSDWFWWFGKSPFSDRDAVFERLFREHLRGVYRALNEPIPPHLYLPLEGSEGSSERKPGN